MKRSSTPQLFMCLAALFGPACATSIPEKSPSTAGTEVSVHQGESKPVLVHVERQGDSSWALAATLSHGGDTGTSVKTGEFLRHALGQRGLAAAYRAFPGAVAVILSTPVGRAPSVNPVEELRHSLAQLAQAPAFARPHPGVPLPLDLCGMGGEPLGLRDVATKIGFESTVLAVVGDAEAIQTMNAFYAAAAPWPAGVSPELALPAQDQTRAMTSGELHELVVARRTPRRAKLAPAARYAGANDSTLALLAGSYPGEWRLMQTHSSYAPGGGCLAVRLVGAETQPLLAARAAKAIADELDWILDEQVQDEDPRMSVLEAVTPEEAATRAAWVTLTRKVQADAPDTTFIHYAGAPIGLQEWQKLVASERTTSDIPLETVDETGQGRVWALLSNPCSARWETASNAGHTALALTAAARTTTQPSSVEAWLTADGSGLIGTLATRSSGAEDRLAEDLARVILRFLQDSSAVVAPRAELIDQLAGDETWDFALRLATDGHASWLVPGPTQYSLMQLGPLAAHRALRRFAAGPFKLAVLSNQGADQSQRLRQRLQHLLSGLRDPLAECPSPAPLPTLSGEYELEASDRAPAVLLYTVDAKYAPTVRQLAAALNAPGGWLAKALNETPVPARARAVGLGSNTTVAALGFSVSGADEQALDHGIAQVRELVARLRREQVKHEGRSAPSLGDPRLRLAELVRSPGPDDPSALTKLLSVGLSEQRLVIVKPLRRPEPGSSAP